MLKKVVCILAVCGILALGAGCHSNVGIIGGADGPTAVYVAE